MGKCLKHIDKLNEAASPQQVMDAIKKRYEAKIYYAGDKDGKGKGMRLIQPVAYGLSKAGNPVVRAFQPYGDTTTKVPHWKLFRLDRIDKWSGIRNRKFDTPPAPQWSADGKFNPEGDKSMSEVYMVADFEGAKRRYTDNLRKHNEKRRAEKLEKDPFYLLKQNIKKSIKNDPEIMKRVAEWQKEQERIKQQQGVAGAQFNNAREMASVKDFGDTNITTTSAPVTKQDTVVQNTAPQQQAPQAQQPKAEKYRNVMNNGPVFKGQEQQREETPDTETENNIENDNEEENNE